MEQPSEGVSILEGALTNPTSNLQVERDKIAGGRFSRFDFRSFCLLSGGSDCDVGRDGGGPPKSPLANDGEGGAIHPTHALISYKWASVCISLFMYA